MVKKNVDPKKNRPIIGKLVMYSDLPKGSAVELSLELATLENEIVPGRNTFVEYQAYIDKKLWQNYVKDRIHGYTGRIEFKITTGEDYSNRIKGKEEYEYIKFLDMPEEEQKVDFPYKSLTDRIETLEAEVRKLKEKDMFQTPMADLSKVKK